jgi:hypothetical protein
MKIAIAILVVLLSLKGFTQSNEAGIIPCKFEKTTETFHNYLEGKITGGLYYKRYFDRFHWYSEFTLAQNKIQDACIQCDDAISGTGKYKEISFASGLGLRVHGQKHSGLVGNVRLLVYAARTGYSGRFVGGPAPVFFDVDNRYNLLGLQLMYSLSYTYKTGFVMGFDVVVKHSKTRPILTNTSALSSYIPPYVTMLAFPSFRIGYQF